MKELLKQSTEFYAQLLLKPREFTPLSYFNFGSILLRAVLTDNKK